LSRLTALGARRKRKEFAISFLRFGPIILTPGICSESFLQRGNHAEALHQIELALKQSPGLASTIAASLLTN
jgi:hypothetical protein